MIFKNIGQFADINQNPKKKRIMQSTDRVLMLRPKNFNFDEETEGSNVFQFRPDVSATELQRMVLVEFDNAVNVLRSVPVRKSVYFATFAKKISFPI